MRSTSRCAVKAAETSNPVAKPAAGSLDLATTDDELMTPVDAHARGNTVRVQPAVCLFFYTVDTLLTSVAVPRRVG